MHIARDVCHVVMLRGAKCVRIVYLYCNSLTAHHDDKENGDDGVLRGGGRRGPKFWSAKD